MNFSKISLCYYPTTVLLVDDNKNFLISICGSLATRKNSIGRLYTRPQEALHYLNSDYKSDPFINHCMQHDEDDSNHMRVDLDVQAIHKEIYNPDRFNEVTALVIDYSMPTMDGAEFCRKVENKKIKKLMLTGAADKELAVRLFNEKTIDKFILKNTNDLPTLLEENIDTLQKQVFIDFSELAVGKSTLPKNLFQCSDDPAYVALFNKIYQSSQAVEYYLLNNQGSFLFLDIAAKPNWLIVVSEEEMNAYLMIAEDGKAPASIIDALKNRTHVPYFHSENDQLTPPTRWEKYLYPAQCLKGEKRYYYSHVTRTDAYDIQPKKILSYSEYIKKYYQPYLEKILS